VSGAIVVSRIDDPWLAVNQTLLRIGADAAAAWGVPLIAALPIRMSGFDGLDAQRLLVRALTARRPDAWLLMADRLSEDSGVERIVAALRLALLLQAASAPVILARAGDLRRLAWTLGVAGAEFGLGRMLRFAVPDFRKAKRGPGPTPGPRMKLPSLVGSAPFEQARRLVGAELVLEAECECPGCAGAGTLDARMAAMAEHESRTSTPRRSPGCAARMTYPAFSSRRTRMLLPPGDRPRRWASCPGESWPCSARRSSAMRSVVRTSSNDASAARADSVA
jgi:hypothetical protein